MEWQPIETAPKDGTSVLVIGPDGVIEQAQWQGPSDGAIYSGSPSRYNWFSEAVLQSIADDALTHWMPLPEPPTRSPDRAEPSAA